MLEFVCDTCSAVKQPDDVWMVGLAAEAIGTVSARREVNIQSSWSRSTAVHPLAVHFCSMRCKDEYMARLFAPEATVQAPLKEVVIERVRPDEVLVEQVVPETEKVVTKRRKIKHHRKRAA
jgi:hypothetical protein